MGSSFVGKIIKYENLLGSEDQVILDMPLSRTYLFDKEDLFAWGTRKGREGRKIGLGNNEMVGTVG